MPTPEKEAEEPKGQWLVDGQTVYLLHVPADPRYERGQPQAENFLWFHVSAGRGVPMQTARVTALELANTLNERGALLAENQRLKELLKHINDAGQLVDGCATCTKIRALDGAALNPPE